jgi:mannose-1-phosphate guanylyltransferase
MAHSYGSNPPYGLILAGGRGTRFWPKSRRNNAKQVLRLFGERSLIQQTVDRLRPVLPPERMWILTNDYLRAEIVRQLPEVPSRQILAEPVQRNTAPAIGLAAHIIQSVDKDAVMGVFPSDHVISKPREYVRLLRSSFRTARDGKIVVLGIEPRWPETGYGYIEFPKGAHSGASEAVPIARFREKPDLATAKRFLKAGNYAWNAGMFFWRTSVLLENLRRHLPKTASLIASLPDFGAKTFPAQLKRIFPLCENISVDFAVLEKATGVHGLLADIGWNDVGSWNAVFELFLPSRSGNVARSDVLTQESAGNYVDAPGKLVALLGVNGMIVVDTPDALLVADRKRAQEVGEIVKILEKGNRDDLL